MMMAMEECVGPLCVVASSVLTPVEKYIKRKNFHVENLSLVKCRNVKHLRKNYYVIH